VADEMHVMKVAVAPALRRQGLARRLLAFAMGRAAKAGAGRALLEVRAGHREALGLYESLGFTPLGVRRAYYREPIEDALVLARERLGGPASVGGGEILNWPRARVTVAVGGSGLPGPRR
jgi:ribosomal protein S18 acetylase RimI-like enzyme